MKKIKSLSSGRTTGDGKMAAFQVVAEGGTTQEFELPCHDIPDFIQYIACVAEDAAKKRTNSTPKKFKLPEHVEIAPLPFTHVGISTHPDPDKALLVFRNFDFDLGFAMNADQLDNLADGARQTATLLRGGRNH
jgi:hypothetical protein